MTWPRPSHGREAHEAELARWAMCRLAAWLRVCVGIMRHDRSGSRRRPPGRAPRARIPAAASWSQGFSSVSELSDSAARSREGSFSSNGGGHRVKPVPPITSGSPSEGGKWFAGERRLACLHWQRAFCRPPRDLDHGRQIAGPGRRCFALRPQRTRSRCPAPDPARPDWRRLSNPSGHDDLLTSGF